MLCGVVCVYNMLWMDLTYDKYQRQISRIGNVDLFISDSTGMQYSTGNNMHMHNN